MILYFSTPTCAPCKTFQPVVREVQSELGVFVQYIDAQANTALAQKYAVSVVPTIIVENGGNVVYRNSGVMSKPQLKQILSQFR